MATPFEQFVNTELPTRVGIPVPVSGSLTAGKFLKATGVGLQMEETDGGGGGALLTSNTYTVESQFNSTYNPASPQADYDSIQDAIDAVPVLGPYDWWTILVGPGYYLEAITLKSRVSIVGLNGDPRVGAASTPMGPDILLYTAFGSPTGRALVTGQSGGVSMMENIYLEGGYSSSGSCVMAPTNSGRLLLKNMRMTHIVKDSDSVVFGVSQELLNVITNGSFPGGIVLCIACTFTFTAQNNTADSVKKDWYMFNYGVDRTINEFIFENCDFTGTYHKTVNGQVSPDTFSAFKQYMYFDGDSASRGQCRNSIFTLTFGTTAYTSTYTGRLSIYDAISRTGYFERILFMGNTVEAKAGGSIGANFEAFSVIGTDASVTIDSMFNSYRTGTAFNVSKLGVADLTNVINTTGDRLENVGQPTGTGGLNISNSITLGTMQTEVKYVPNASGDWNGDPTTIKEAIDRLAVEVAILKGSPIT